MTALERAWEFDRDLQERGAERVLRFEQGAALYNGRLPLVYDANFVRFDSALGELTVDDAERLVEGLQRNLGHRKLLLPDAGARLAAELSERGWSVGRTVVMEYGGSGGPAEGAEIVDPRAIRAARQEALSDRDRETGRQVAAYTEALTRANHGDVVAAFAGGEPAAFCVLYMRDGVAEIDEVTTLRRFRRRGLGTAVLRAALAGAIARGNGLTFLVADATDWPREWYERLGFRAIGNRFEVCRASTLTSA